MVELRLDPLPNGGFVATCNDVTARVRTAEALRHSDRQLRRAAETLEQRVVERTAELEASRAEAEAANLGKTRFIAAASHDLLQPLHAARLFTAALIDRDPGNDLGGKIDASLGAVELLLDALLDISKLDAGAFKPEKRPFALQPLFDSLGTAFAPVAARRDVDLVLVPTHAFVDHRSRPSCAASCRTCLSNALRYGCVEGGRSACCSAAGARAARCASRSRTTGPASPADKQRSSSRSSCACSPRTTGRAPSAGWASASRSSTASPACSTCRCAAFRAGPGLDLLGRGAGGAGRRRAVGGRAAPLPRPPAEAERFVLCIDNEASVREAMATLLRRLGLPRRHRGFARRGARPGDIGRLARPRAGRSPSRRRAGRPRGRRHPAAALERPVPAALITADRDPTLRARARAHQVELLHKPLKPAALRALLRMRERVAP